ncbi:hypothetical protein Bxe_C0907 [Paraburkholderia xenovorans LB400]|uniref:Uncharacterized protein n=1 Tax=Paraburkholderia xenovorans (strain LB400) TaxID=266265 RepID=Q13GK7_PARXL|nr:hypothetical protein Bxe_C0907 [Paraburkholderia xenovorans LB400]
MTGSKQPSPLRRHCSSRRRAISVTNCSVASRIRANTACLCTETSWKATSTVFVNRRALRNGVRYFNPSSRIRPRCCTTSAYPPIHRPQ